MRLCLKPFSARPCHERAVVTASPVPVRIAANSPGRPVLAPASASWTDADRQFHANVSNGLENPSCGLGVFVVDLPGLLEIAETYGDRARHALLQKIEWRLRSLFGPGAVARTAVMRFSLMLQGVLEQDIPSIVERIQAAVCGRQNSIGSGVVIVGLPTVGVALTGKLDGRIRGQAAIVADLIRHAELALQQAVALGKALAAGDLESYGSAHARLLRPARLMSRALLAMGSHPSRTAASMVLLGHVPGLFNHLLRSHARFVADPTLGKPYPTENTPWHAART